jgi:hypothetical protein
VSVWLPVAGNLLAVILAGFITSKIAPGVAHRFSEISQQRDRDLEREKEQQAKLLEKQRHQQEIYKAIYTEQMSVAKQLSELVGKQYVDCFGFFRRTVRELNGTETQQSFNALQARGMLDRSHEIYALTQSNVWLIGNEVTDAANSFARVIVHQSGLAVSETPLDDSSVDVVLKEIEELFRSFSLSLDEHMKATSLRALRGAELSSKAVS